MMPLKTGKAGMKVKAVELRDTPGRHALEVEVGTVLWR